jgi:S-adenosylmethionine hydrolase
MSIQDNWPRHLKVNDIITMKIDQPGTDQIHCGGTIQDIDEYGFILVKIRNKYIKTTDAEQEV